jgi:crossover junction endodeoxyribonuclease RusA
VTRLVLPVPPSAGLYWRLARGRIVKTAAARAYQQGVKMRALAQGCRPVTGPVAVTVQWFRAARRGDLDNHLKVVLDALQGAVYRNDNQIVELHAYRLEDRQNPRLWIVVEELAP